MTQNPPDLRPILLSIKPYYADLIFRGLKRAELRRLLGNRFVGRNVYIYVSSPVCELQGGFRAGQQWSGSPSEVWDFVADLAAVSEEDFERYYEDRSVAYALEVKDAWQFSNPLSLQELRERFPGFAVPQSFRYLRDCELRSFRLKKRTTKHSGTTVHGKAELASSSWWK